MRTLVQVITGGRPLLKDRVTRHHFDSLRGSGFPDIEWVIREDHVEGYEVDEVPFNVYPLDWANGYARAHWRHPTAKFIEGGFHGAFAGREWAMRSAEVRGFDYVLQLDDNVQAFGVLGATERFYKAAITPGELALLLVKAAESTNLRMVGAQLSSVVPEGSARTIRPGYPYSVFVEKAGPGRLPYFGPFEDDVMHALDYATGPSPFTAGVMEVLRYLKVHGGSSGMRSAYDATRGLEIARRYPRNVRLGLGARTSGPADSSRGVRHFLNTNGFTPVRVTDPDLYAEVDAEVRERVEVAKANKRRDSRAKILKRAGLPPEDNV